MPKFRVCLYTERILEADNDDEAAQRFKDDDTIYEEIEVERVEESDGTQSKCARPARS